MNKAQLRAMSRALTKPTESEQFDSMLRELVHSRGVDWLFRLPGVYEIASEELNNDVLEALGREAG